MKATFFFFAFLLALASLASIDARDQLSRGALRRETLTERRLEGSKGKGDKSKKSKSKGKGDKSKKSKSKGKGDKSKKSKSKGKGDKSKKSKSKGKGDKSKKSKSKGKGDKSKKSKSKGKGDKSKKSKSKGKGDKKSKSKDKEARTGVLSGQARTAAALELLSRQSETPNTDPLILNREERAAVAASLGFP
jgi:hypothetical protein